jgi:hypothetical protein
MAERDDGGEGDSSARGSREEAHLIERNGDTSNREPAAVSCEVGRPSPVGEGDGGERDAADERYVWRASIMSAHERGVLLNAASTAPAKSAIVANSRS